VSSRERERESESVGEGDSMWKVAIMEGEGEGEGEMWETTTMEERGISMKAITKSDIKRVRRAIKIAERNNDYDLIVWCFGEVEAVMNKAESVINKSKEVK
jgi:hypothetical protein